jgi:hypothetical protein
MARIGGAFPLPLAQVQEGGTRVELASGGTFYFPPGEYIVKTDSETQIEFFDGQSQTWQILYPVSTGGYLSADGYNFRAHNITGIVSGNTIATAGSGMTNGIGPTATGVAISYGASNTTGYPTATGWAVIGGSVAAPTITQAGSGFIVPPLIVIDPPPPGGVQATAIAILTAFNATTGSGIATITMENVGGGYAATPNFWIIPQTATYQGGPSGGTIAAAGIPAPGLVYPTNAVPGNQNTSATGAQLTSVALTGSGTLTGVGISDSGGGYTGAPTVTITGGSGSVAITALAANTSPAASLLISQPRVQ